VLWAAVLPGRPLLCRRLKIAHDLAPFLEAKPVQVPRDGCIGCQYAALVRVSAPGEFPDFGGSVGFEITTPQLMQGVI
jgi:hypothetical protein